MKTEHAGAFLCVRHVFADELVFPRAGGRSLFPAIRSVIDGDCMASKRSLILGTTVGWRCRWVIPEYNPDDQPFVHFCEWRSIGA